jgi:drug/metabolite transporter (DMT)-like permease
MPNKTRSRMDDVLLISRVAHVVERTGLAMAGAMCGTFVAALQSSANAELFDSAGFIVSMVLLGAIGFYLGINIPRLRVRPRVDPVELLSATGTFLATIAALVSVYAFVFDEIPRGAWDFTVVSWWMLGVAMLIGAGLIGRLRLARRAAV